MSTTGPTIEVLAPTVWRARRAAHEARADAALADVVRRRAVGERHPVEDFLFTYYSLRPAQLRRWRAGAFTALAQDDGTIAEFDLAKYLSRRGETVRFIHQLLVSTASRSARFTCFGLHEWAMVYRQPEHRHPDPLRLGQAATDALVEANRIQCSHYDAYRFFTPQALPRNELRPTAATRTEFEQPGCLHAGMDLYKWAYKLGDAVPAELLFDCFELARDIRVLDMRASPYDLTSWGYPPVRIETAEGRAEYVAAQRVFSERAARLRAALITCTEPLLDSHENQTP